MPDPVIMEFRDREEALVWIIQNQRGRRSINSYVQMELVAKLRPKIASQASLRQRAAQRNVAAEKAKQKAIELNAPINTRNTLAELAKVSENTMQKGLDLIEKAPEELKQKLRKGEISINQAHKLVKKPKDKEPSGRRLKSGTSQQESSLAAANSSEMVSPVPNIEPCDLIVINPPWEQGDHGAYRPMPVQEIAGLPLDRMATENSLLWLWTPNVHLRDAHVLLDRWGFTYRALFTWIFESSESGQWLKNGSAQCLLASKGSPLSENIQPMRSWIQAEREAEARTPLDFYLRITSAYPVSRRLDVFSDKPREGWIQWPSRKS
jgi:N6-adenosine-specific RNA methylase IME4